MAYAEVAKDRRRTDSGAQGGSGRDILVVAGGAPAE